MITSPVALTATARMGERLAIGQAGEQRPRRARHEGPVHTQPVMSPAKRRRSAAYGPRSAMAISRLVARLRVLPAPGRLPPSNQMPLPPLSTTHVSPLVVGAQHGCRRLLPLADRGEQRRDASRSGRRPAPRGWRRRPARRRGRRRPAARCGRATMRPPSSEMKKPWLSPPATSRPEGSSATTVMKPAPWIGPELNRAGGGVVAGEAVVVDTGERRVRRQGRCPSGAWAVGGRVGRPSWPWAVSVGRRWCPSGWSCRRDGGVGRDLSPMPRRPPDRPRRGRRWPPRSPTRCAPAGRRRGLRSDARPHHPHPPALRGAALRGAPDPTSPVCPDRGRPRGSVPWPRRLGGEAAGC